MQNEKKKSSVFVALFGLDERDGWFTPGIVQFITAMTATKDRALCLQTQVNTKPVDYARNCIVKDFLASDFQWLLMLDSDMSPPPNLLEMIDRAEKFMDILVPKFYLFVSTLQQYTKNPNLPLVLGWQPLTTSLGERAWCELDCAGAGCMFVHRRVFERMGNQGWFQFGYDSDGKMTDGEDINFCKKARRAGFRVFGNNEFATDHFKTVSLLALERSIGALIPSPLANMKPI